MRYLLARWAVLALAIAVTAWLLPGFTIHEGVVGTLIVAAVLGLINAFIRPIVMFLTCPLVIVTLGLFALVVNAMMLSLTAWLLPELVSLDNFWSTLFASVIISVISAVLMVFVHDNKSRW
jgi:putative membrane protein